MKVVEGGEGGEGGEEQATHRPFRSRPQPNECTLPSRPYFQTCAHRAMDHLRMDGGEEPPETPEERAAALERKTQDLLLADLTQAQDGDEQETAGAAWSAEDDKEGEGKVEAQGSHGHETGKVRDSMSALSAAATAARTKTPTALRPPPAASVATDIFPESNVEEHDKNDGKEHEAEVAAAESSKAGGQLSAGETALARQTARRGDHRHIFNQAGKCILCSLERINYLVAKGEGGGEYDEDGDSDDDDGDNESQALVEPGELKVELAKRRIRRARLVAARRRASQAGTDIPRQLLSGKLQKRLETRMSESAGDTHRHFFNSLGICILCEAGIDHEPIQDDGAAGDEDPRMTTKMKKKKKKKKAVKMSVKKSEEEVVKLEGSTAKKKKTTTSAKDRRKTVQVPKTAAAALSAIAMVKRRMGRRKSSTTGLRRSSNVSHSLSTKRRQTVAVVNQPRMQELRNGRKQSIASITTRKKGEGPRKKSIAPPSRIGSSKNGKRVRSSSASTVHAKKMPSLPTRVRISKVKRIVVAEEKVGDEREDDEQEAHEDEEKGEEEEGWIENKSEDGNGGDETLLITDDGDSSSKERSQHHEEGDAGSTNKEERDRNISVDDNDDSLYSSTHGSPETSRNETKDGEGTVRTEGVDVAIAIREATKAMSLLKAAIDAAGGGQHTSINTAMEVPLALEKEDNTRNTSTGTHLRHDQLLGSLGDMSAFAQHETTGLVALVKAPRGDMVMLPLVSSSPELQQRLKLPGMEEQSGNGVEVAVQTETKARSGGTQTSDAQEVTAEAIAAEAEASLISSQEQGVEKDVQEQIHIHSAEVAFKQHVERMRGRGKAKADKHSKSVGAGKEQAISGGYVSDRQA